MDAAEEHGFERIWTVSGSAIPGGPVSREAFDYFSGHLLEGMQASGKIDGVLLHLHGAMVTDDLDDGEGHVLEAIRRLVGPDIPIVTTLDLHANMTPRMIRNCHALTGYDTCPHVDMYERAREAANILVRIIRGELRPTMVLECPPLLTPLQTQVPTHDTPMKRIIDLVHRLEEDPRVISIAAFGGCSPRLRRRRGASLTAPLPFADIALAGFSCVVVTDNDAALAARLARQVTDAAVAEGDQLDRAPHAARGSCTSGHGGTA
jgi:microcystin degradation protein MlrC